MAETTFFPRRLILGAAVISGVLLLRARMLPFWLILPLGYLCVVFLLLKSTGALLLGFIFIPLILFASVRAQLRVIVAVLARKCGHIDPPRAADLAVQTLLRGVGV